MCVCVRVCVCVHACVCVCLKTQMSAVPVFPWVFVPVQGITNVTYQDRVNSYEDNEQKWLGCLPAGSYDSCHSHIIILIIKSYHTQILSHNMCVGRNFIVTSFLCRSTKSLLMSTCIHIIYGVKLHYRSRYKWTLTVDISSIIDSYTWCMHACNDVYILYMELNCTIDLDTSLHACIHHVYESMIESS